MNTVAKDVTSGKSRLAMMFAGIVVSAFLLAFVATPEAYAGSWNFSEHKERKACLEGAVAGGAGGAVVGGGVSVVPGAAIGCAGGAAAYEVGVVYDWIS